LEVHHGANEILHGSSIPAVERRQAGLQLREGLDPQGTKGLFGRLQPRLELALQRQELFNTLLDRDLAQELCLQGFDLGPTLLMLT
jgi:hypothetical protein